jgi:hypothetical protein
MLFRFNDMLFTKFSQNAAQIEQTKGFDPMQRARRARAFCCPSERRKLLHPFQMMRNLRATRRLANFEPHQKEWISC